MTEIHILNTIQKKITVSSAICMILIGFCIALFVWINISDLSITTAENEMQIYAGKESKAIEAFLSEGLESAKILASVFSASIENGNGISRDDVVEILKKAKMSNPDIFGYFIAFEPNAFDHRDVQHINTLTSDETGRFLADVMLEDNNWVIESIHNVESEEFYLIPKTTGSPYISEPYIDVNTLIVSISVPIFAENDFIGVVGTEIPLTSLQKDADEIEIYNKQAIMTIQDESGIIIASTGNKDLIGKERSTTILYKDHITENGGMEVFVPMTMDETKTTWTISLSAPLSVIVAEEQNIIHWMMLIIIILTLLGIGFMAIISQKIAKPIHEITAVAEKIGLGHLNTEIPKGSQDETGLLSEAFRTMTKALHRKAEIIDNISKGKLDIEISPLSDHDDLAFSLIHLRENIRTITSAIQTLATHAEEGTLSYRSNPAQSEGVFRDCLLSLNEALEHIETPITKAMEISASYASCDFSARYDSQTMVKGEFIRLKRSLDNVGEEVSDAIIQVRSVFSSLLADSISADEKASDVAMTAINQSHSSEVMLRNVKEAHQSVEQIIKVMEDLNVSISDIATQADEVSKISYDAEHLSGEGSKYASETSKVMQEIRESTEGISTVISNISLHMEDISRITDMIREISDQTGLLALNAAIEAARAGEAGRGFSVVAEEVKSLAQMTQNSAEEIATIINQLVKQTQDASVLMEEGMDEVKSGSDVLEQTILTFSNISELIVKINKNITNMASSTEEQAAAFEEIISNVHTLEEFIQKTGTDSEALLTESSNTARLTEMIADLIKGINVNTTQVGDDLNRFIT